MYIIPLVIGGRAMRCVLVMMVLCAASYGDKVRYVPVRCMSRMEIVSFGKCKTEGGRHHCASADIMFTIGCTSTKPEVSSTQMEITMPGAMEVE
jgi:hypothetical protein